MHRESGSDDYGTPAAGTPSPRNQRQDWLDQHDDFVRLASSSSSELCLFGASIAKGLARYPSVWRNSLKPLNALNFGFGGDRTEHVLWRVENSEVPRCLRYAVIICGTNNLDKHDPCDIANSLIKIAVSLQRDRHGCFIFINGLLPRDFNSQSRRRKKARKVNSFLRDLC